eukprot:3273727-Prymnesium_polylepis.1
MSGALVSAQPQQQHRQSAIAMSSRRCGGPATLKVIVQSDPDLGCAILQSQIKPLMLELHPTAGLAVSARVDCAFDLGLLLREGVVGSYEGEFDHPVIPRAYGTVHRLVAVCVAGLQPGDA